MLDFLRGQQVPYWPLSAFYFTYFALLGATFPYWSLYLESLGFDPFQIGLLMAVPMATKVIAPSLWGWAADKTGQVTRVIRIGSFLAFISFTLIFLGQSFWLFAGVFFLYSFFWNAVLPQHEVVTLHFLGNRPEYYSWVRVWGSVGFIVLVILGGVLFDGSGLEGFPLIAWLLLGAIWLSSLWIPRLVTTHHHSHQGHFLEVCLQPVVMAFLVASALLQVSHGVYYSFYSIYLDSLGYNRLSIGLLWSVGVVSEVLIFLVMHRFMMGFGVRKILLFSLFLSFIRWLLIGHLADTILILIVAQTFHAFTFAAFHSAAIETVRRLFPSAHQGRGQAVYSGVSFGLGGAIGSIFGGYIWKSSPVYSYDFAAVASLLAFVVVYIWMKEQKLVERHD